MQFLEAGDKLGFPRLGYGPGRRVAMGEGAWTAFASSAPLRNLAPALRNAHILAGYITESVAALAHGESIPLTETPERVEAELLYQSGRRQKLLDNLAKARAAKAAKKEAAV